MISANISRATRKAVYRREGFRCAICDSTDGLQIHHVRPRSRGGSDSAHNLIALCWRCHAGIHGTNVYNNPGFDQDAFELAIVEYLSDFYAENGIVWQRE